MRSKAPLLLLPLVGLFVGLLALPLSAAAAPARLGEAEVRAFVARQSKAWNDGDLAVYFRLFTPDATFTDQGRAKDGRVVPYGVSTVAKARAQAKRSLAKSKVSETTAIRAIALAADGRGARVTSAEQTIITKDGRARRLCAERLQTLVLTSAGLRSKGQVDTYVSCR